MRVRPVRSNGGILPEIENEKQLSNLLVGQRRPSHCSPLLSGSPIGPTNQRPNYSTCFRLETSELLYGVFIVTQGE